jgi:hypothetical protein
MLYAVGVAIAPRFPKANWLLTKTVLRLIRKMGPGDAAATGLFVNGPVVAVSVLETRSGCAETEVEVADDAEFDELVNEFELWASVDVTEVLTATFDELCGGRPATMTAMLLLLVSSGIDVDVVGTRTLVLVLALPISKPVDAAAPDVTVCIVVGVGGGVIADIVVPVFSTNNSAAQRHLQSQMPAAFEVPVPRITWPALPADMVGGTAIIVVVEVLDIACEVAVAESSTALIAGMLAGLEMPTPARWVAVVAAAAALPAGRP